MIKSGRIGKVKSVEVSLMKGMCPPSGGVLSDFGIYALDFLHQFSPAGSYRMSVYRDNMRDGSDTGWRIVGSMLPNVSIKAVLSNSHAADSRGLVVGELGSIEFPSPFNRTNQVHLASRNGALVEELNFNYQADGFEYEIREIEAMLSAKSVSSDWAQSSVETAGLMEKLLLADEGYSEIPWTLSGGCGE